MENQHPVDHLFRSGLENRPVAWDPTHWEAAQELLRQKRRKRRWLFWWTSLGAGLLLVTAAWWFFPEAAPRTASTQSYVLKESIAVAATSAPDTNLNSLNNLKTIDVIHSSATAETPLQAKSPAPAKMNSILSTKAIKQIPEAAANKTAAGAPEGFFAFKLPVQLKSLDKTADAAGKASEAALGETAGTAAQEPKTEKRISESIATLPAIHKLLPEERPLPEGVSTKVHRETRSGNRYAFLGVMAGDQTPGYALGGGWQWPLGKSGWYLQPEISFLQRFGEAKIFDERSYIRYSFGRSETAYRLESRRYGFAAAQLSAGKTIGRHALASGIGLQYLLLAQGQVSTSIDSAAWAVTRTGNLSLSDTKRLQVQWTAGYQYQMRYKTSLGLQVMAPIGATSTGLPQGTWFQLRIVQRF